MDERERRGDARTQTRKYWAALAAVAFGAALAAVGVVFGLDKAGDEATGWGVASGVGVGLVLGGALLAWRLRPGARERLETGQSKRDRLQAERVRQLWGFPLVMLAFMVQSTLAMQDILAGEGNFADYISAPLPVVYAWVVASIAMGWDHLSRTHRKYLEDELTAVLRARAVGAAFVVLMAGGTIAFGLALWRPELGVAALPFVLSAGGATAGIRFAWLDREFGKDG